MKALQALYNYFISQNSDLVVGERTMLKSTERIYELITWQLAFMVNLVKFAAKRQEENKKKFYPTTDDLNPNTKFTDNQLIAKLTQNKDYQRKVNAYKVNWVEEDEMVRKVYNEMRSTSSFETYMNSGKHSFDEDRSIIATLFSELVAYQDFIDYFYEEKNIYWANDLEIANPLVIKIIKGIRKNDDEFALLPTLYNTTGKEEPDEDKDFMIRLYHKTVLKSDELENIIKNKANNWELNRIATMDVILLKMALTELMEFQSIPTKVTLNEYIELSKYYSTPKSKVFINGILDKLIVELKEEKKIIKIGRGLMD
jgi:N utilization substance protein B